MATDLAATRIVRHQATAGNPCAHLNRLTAPLEILTPLRSGRRATTSTRSGSFWECSSRGRGRGSDRRDPAAPCTDHLKEIVYRCIGERRKRYESADELIAALSHRPAALKPGALRSLAGVHLAFTGILSKRRSVAVRAARRAGATVHGAPSAKTTVVVRGRPNPLQAAGREGGRKLLEIKRLREKGQRITLLDEKRFWKLVSR